MHGLYVAEICRREEIEAIVGLFSFTFKNILWKTCYNIE